MSQPSKGLNELYALSKLFTCKGIKLSAWSNSTNHELLVMYIEDGVFIYYLFTEEQPIIKQVSWFTDPIHTPVSIDLSPSGCFLLVLSQSCHLYILPVLSIIESTDRHNLCLDTSDLTIHTYPFSSKLTPSQLAKSKFQNSSLNTISSLSQKSSSSISSINDKEKSSSCSSSSFTLANDNILKLKESLSTKCTVNPTAVCWWQSIHSPQDVSIIGTKSGNLLFVDLISGQKLGDINIQGEVKSLSICHDKSAGNHFLLIQATNNEQYKLILEQDNPSYLWPGVPNSTGSEDADSMDSPQASSGSGNYLPSARARLQGLKQLSAEKLASLKHRIAETRSKMGAKQGPSYDLHGKMGGLTLENLTALFGDTLISPQCCHDTNVLVGYYNQSQLLTVYPMSLEVSPIFICKMPIETEDVLLGDHVIFALSNNRTTLQVISSKLSETCVNRDFNTDSVLGKWNLKQLNESFESEETAPEEEKITLAKPDLIPEDFSGVCSERILSLYRSRGKVEEYDIAKVYNLEKSKEELPDVPEVERCIAVSSRSVYVVELTSNVVKMALDLILELHELEKAEQICTVFGINLQKLLELAGDIKLAASEFPTAIALFKLSKCGLLKSIIKLACGNHCSQVLNYSTMLMANSITDMTFTERIHLSNLILMAYTQQILKSENNRGLMDKFLDFLQTNTYFDEILAVSVTGQSLLFPCLYVLITHRGLLLDGYNILIKLMDRFMSSRVLEWSLNKKEFWKCATVPELIEPMVIKAESFAVYAEYVAQHLNELDPHHLRRLLVVLDPTAPAVRPVARSFKKENSFDNDDTQTAFPFGKLVELFLMAMLVKLHKERTGKEDYERELVLPSETVDGEDNSFTLNEESFGSGETSGEEIWPIRKDIQGEPEKFNKRLETVLSCGYGHTALIRNGCVYTWGQTAKGCLGHGPTMSRYASPSPLSWFTALKLQVSVVSCGKFHTAALTNNGIYTWGCSRYGQLGLGDVHGSPHPMLVKGLADEDVITVRCGQFHTLALTTQGSVFAWGWGIHGQLGLGSVDDQRVPALIHTLKEHFVVDVAAGHGHSLILSEKGRVYSFGSSVFGQLGTGNTSKSSTPVLVKGINGRVVSIATGYFHSLALTDANTLYTWGSSPQCLRFQAQARKRSRLLQNQNPAEGESSKGGETNQEPSTAASGLLDKRESEIHLSPSLVDLSNVSGKIVEMCCGCHHSALVTDCGGVYTWGRSIDGQLGNGGHREVQIPTQIGGESLRADHISCGCEFTTAEEKHTGKIYCWGSNSIGQLAVPIKESAMKSLDGKLVMIKSCKRIVRLLDRGAGSNSIETPREVPEIPPPAFTYRTLRKHVTPSSVKLSHFNPEFSQRSLHFVIEKFSSFVNPSTILKKSLECNNFQAASKVSLLQNKCKQSVVYQLKALQNLPKYHLKSGFYSEKQKEVDPDKKTGTASPEIQLFTVEGGQEDLCDDSQSENPSTTNRECTAEEKCEGSLEEEKLQRLKLEYMDHAKYILEVYMNLNRRQSLEDFDNCFILETGIQFWTAEKLPMSSLESFLLEKLDDVYYDLGYLLFCAQPKDDKATVLEQFSSSFLLEITSRILRRVEKNESCVEYLEAMANLLTKDDLPGRAALAKRKRPPKKRKLKSETCLEQILDSLRQQRLSHNLVKISYGDVIADNVYVFSCGHHHSPKSLKEDLEVFREIADETVASKLVSFYGLLESEHRGDLACPSCVRDYLRQ